MKSSVLVILGIACAFLPGLRAQHTGPVPPPTEGFGAPGPYAVERREFPSPGFAGQVVTVVSPVGTAGPRPTWFFAHGYSGFRYEFYAPLLEHLASHGWAAVFSPCPLQEDGVLSLYDIFFSGFVAAAELYPEIIDTGRVGFAGHSFGGGASPTLLLRATRELGWGADARCLMMMAPWYSFGLTNDDLAGYPAGTQAVVQVYEDDLANDHRMAIDVFRRLGLPAADKDYLLIRSDEIAGYAYHASHGVPGPSTPIDALKTHGVFRIAAALAASTFDGSPAGRAVALGGGSAVQCAMGEDAGGRTLRPMVADEAPVALYPQSRYAFRFSALLNPRRLDAPPEAPVAGARLVNLSVRARSETGDRVLVAGAAVQGTRPKSLLVRGAGPALAPFGVNPWLPDPRLSVFRGPAFDLGNDAWEAAPNLPALTVAVGETGAFPFAAGSADAAVLASFAPGTLTAQVTPAAGGPGIALVELYDADIDGATRLVNLSARAYVDTGDALLVAGFVVRGAGTITLLIRAVGPTLEAFDVDDVLADPRLVVRDEAGGLVGQNDDWLAQADPAAIVAAAAAVGAFPLPEGSRDASVLVTLPAGLYTAQASDAAGGAGNVLVEVYALP